MYTAKSDTVRTLYYYNRYSEEVQVPSVKPSNAKNYDGQVI